MRCSAGIIEGGGGGVRNKVDDAVRPLAVRERGALEGTRRKALWLEPAELALLKRLVGRRGEGEAEREREEASQEAKV